MQTLTDNLMLSTGNYVRLHWFGQADTVLIAQRLADGSLVNAATGDPITEHTLKSWSVGESFSVN